MHKNTHRGADGKMYSDPIAELREIQRQIDISHARKCVRCGVSYKIGEGLELTPPSKSFCWPCDHIKKKCKRCGKLFFMAGNVWYCGDKCRGEAQSPKKFGSMGKGLVSRLKSLEMALIDLEEKSTNDKLIEDAVEILRKLKMNRKAILTATKKCITEIKDALAENEMEKLI